MKVILKDELTLEMAIEQNMSIVSIYKYYFPGAEIEEVDFFFWECTPFPFSTDKALEMLYQKYLSTMNALYPQTKY